MAEKFYTILTNIGKAKIANSTAFGKKVNLVKFKVGDSNGKYYEPNENQTDLVNPIYEGNINDIEVDADNSNWIKVQLLIPANIGGFTIREYAVYDDENNMIAIAKCAESYKPLSSDGSTKELELEMVIAVTNTETINMQIDPTIIFSTKKDINNLQTQIDKNTASLNESAQNITNLQNNKAPLVSTPQCTTNHMNIYVSNNGNDSNDGLSAERPLRTIQRAVDIVPRNLRHYITIHIAKGRYEPASIVGFYGNGEITIKGAEDLSSEYTIKTITTLRNKTCIKFYGLSFYSADTHGFLSENDDRIIIEKCIIDSGNKVEHPGIITAFSMIEVTDTTINNRNNAIFARLVAHVISRNTKGTNNNNGLVADTGAVIAKAGTQPNGTTSELTYEGGVIR